ncbi:hypothetical protein CFT12S02847_08820, partial [Campylobacter fetus subsp. testudinum]
HTTANNAEHTTIADFSIGDSIVFDAAAANVTAYANVGTVQGNDIATAIAAALALTVGTITSADQAKSVYGFKWEYNGTTETYLYYNSTNGETTTVATDTLVKLSGNVDLDSISLNTGTATGDITIA